MEYENQHWVTKSYLKAWCDPKTPNNGAYVWTVSKDSHIVSRKSPRILFSEADFYTFYDSNGNRNVDFEKWLQKIEDDFILVYRDKLGNRKPLTDADFRSVAMFIATMFARVKKQRDQQREMWQNLLDQFGELPKDTQDYLMATGKHDQIVNLRNQPMLYNIINFANVAMPFLSKMHCEILETETKPGFITSDNPCFLIDPAIYSSNPPKDWFSLFSSQAAEIIFPISPRQAISLKPNGPDIYMSIDKVPEAIDGINKLIAWNSDEFIVLNQKEYKEFWFG